MIGLYFFFLMGVWVLIALSLTRFIAKRIKDERWRKVGGVLIFLFLLPLPLIDEIVGAQQFKHLCEANSTIEVDRAKAVGKTVYLNSIPEVQIQHLFIPVFLHHWQFLDVKTKESVVEYKTLRAESGMFVKPFSAVPLVFHSTCEAGERVLDPLKLFEKLGIQYVDISKNSGSSK